jgi:hypothetical protein
MGCTSSKPELRPPAAETLPPKSLEDLPNELLENILREACTDGERAGCALSLVSWRMHNVGAPFRYRSIALSGNAQICAFRDLVQALQAHGLPVPWVEALFLQCIRPGVYPWERQLARTKFDTTGLVLGSSSMPLGVSSSSDPHDGHTLQPVAVVDEDVPLEQDYVEWAPSIVSLLLMIAPTLQSLALVMDCLQITTHVPVTLPSLAELTCVRFYHDLNAMLNAPYQPRNQIYLDQKLPALRRLHLVHKSFSPRFCTSSEIPPALTHLRLTGESSTELERSLAWLSNPSPGHSISALWPPRRLERILTSPRHQENMGLHLIYPSLYKEVDPMRWWHAAQSAVDISERVGIVLEPQMYDAQQVYEHWLDRLQDRPGCWVSGEPLAEFAQFSGYGKV